MLLFHPKAYHYEELARKYSAIVAKNLPSDQFYSSLLNFLCENFNSEGGCFILKEKEKYAVRQCLGFRIFSFKMDDCSSFVNWLAKNKKTITRSQLLDDHLFSPIKQAGLNFFIQLQAEACIPLMDGGTGGGDLIGLITLSAKKGRKPYKLSCRIVLDWIGNQIAAGLYNALLQEKIRSLHLELDSVKDLKTQIVANLSHELRTPLTGIIGFAELLSEEIDGNLNEEQKRHVSQILEGGNRLLRTLSSLVDLAKLEAGNLSMHVQQFHLAPLVVSLSDEIPLNAATRLNVRLESGTPWIYGDLNLVREIFKNLLGNAAKYTPQGEVSVSAAKKGEMLEVCVADTGIGISEEKLGRIFDGFYQVNGSLTREFQGTGIGLALSKKLIEIHGGRLWAKSQVGHGSRFYFTLPLKPITIKHKELAA